MKEVREMYQRFLRVFFLIPFGVVKEEIKKGIREKRKCNKS